MGTAVDTSALVALERQGEALVDQLPPDAADIYVPALVIAELWIGVELVDSEQRRSSRLAKIQALIDSADILPFDERVAPTYARVYAGLRRAGTPIPANDLAIASVSIHFGHELVVGPQDEQHFRNIQGLVVRVLGAG